MNALTIFCVLVIVYAAMGMLLRRFALKGLLCTRAFSKPAVFEGETGEMIEVVRNDRPLLIPWLRVESRISPHIRLGQQDNLLVSDTTHACSLFTLMPYQQIRRRHKVAFLHRGAYSLGNATLTAGDMLGLFTCTREQDMAVPILVYPRMLEDSQIPAPLFQLLGEVVSRRSLLSDPFLIRGIRPYQIGDSIRDIHWPATARTGEMQVRMFDHAASVRLLVVLNAQLREGQWGDRLMDYEQEAIESVIALGATLCCRALRMGAEAGFAANMPLEAGGGSTLVLPAGCSAQEEALLTAFARLQIYRTDHFYDLLDSLAAYSNLSIIAISCYQNERIDESIASLRRAGNDAHLYLLGGDAS